MVQLEWTSDQIAVVAATGLLSSVGSVVIFGQAELRRRRRSGCVARLLGASFSGASGCLAGIVAACVLSESMSHFPLLTVGLSTSVALSVDLTSRAGWVMLLRLLIALLSSGLAALSRRKDGDDENEPETT